MNSNVGDPIKTKSLLFEVSNHHTAACGKAPTINGDTPDMYFGYFANGYGEQAIYRYDYHTGEAVVRMGDCGWENVYRVVNGKQDEGRLRGPRSLLDAAH